MKSFIYKILFIPLFLYDLFVLLFGKEKPVGNEELIHRIKNLGIRPRQK